MTPLEHIAIIEELVINRASPGEIRGHLIAIREALEAYEQLKPEHAKLKETQAKEAADAKTKYDDLLIRHLELKNAHPDEPPDSGYPRSGIIR